MHNSSVDHLRFTFFWIFFDTRIMGVARFATKSNATSRYMACHSPLLFPPDLAIKGDIDAYLIDNTLIYVGDTASAESVTDCGGCRVTRSGIFFK